MRRFIFSVAAVIALTAVGTEYFVSPNGQAGADGKSEKTAFNTIQQGMDALQAGDTLTILPGKYHEAVQKVMKGDPAKRTVIRAKHPGTVLIYSDLPLPEFQVHDQDKGLYVAKCDVEPEAVFEKDSLSLYERRDPSFLTMSIPDAGSYFYDEQQKLLYLRTTDAKAPSTHILSQSKFSSDGFAIRPENNGKVVNVEIDGLTVRGFMTQKVGFQFASWGIAIYSAENCMIRRCLATMNCGGICMYGASKSRIEECVGIRNGTIRQVSGGNIIIWSGDDSIIDKCFSYFSRTYGIRFYGSNNRDTISRCISIAEQRGSIWIKPSDEFSKLSEIFSPSLVACKHSEYSLFRVNDYDPKGANGKTSLAFGKDTVLNSYPESFADVTNFDFRLTRGSKFQQGFKGQNFCYLAPNGDDKNDGLSQQSPKKSLGSLPEGATAYLLPGKYEEDVVVSQNAVTISGYGLNAPAVICGNLKVTGNNVRLQKLSFIGAKEAVTCTGSDLTVENCGFANAATAVNSAKPATISHCAFDASVKNAISGADDSVVKFSILHSAPEKAQLFGNAYFYNPPANDVAGIQLQAQFNDAAQGNFTLKNERDFIGRAEDTTLIGPAFISLEPVKNNYFNMKVHPVGNNAATLQYESDDVLKTPRVNYREAGGKWRTTDDRTVMITLAFVSLENLKPNTEYECYGTSKLQNKYILGNHYLPAKLDYNKPGNNRSQTLKFTTPAEAHEPRTLHVSVKGDDNNPGTLEKPLLNINTAALKTGPGDTVVVHEGVYHESILVPNSGTPDKPISYCAAPGETVWLDGNTRQLCRAFGAFGKHDLKFDGFRIRMFGTALANGCGIFTLFHCNNIAISRTLYDGRSPGYSPHILHARFVKNLTMRNCVDCNSMSGIAIIDCNNVVIENNVMKLISIWPLFCMGKDEHCVRFAYNIVTDNSRAKTTEPLLKMTNQKTVDEAYNIFFTRYPRELRIIAGTHDGKKWKLDEYYKLVGKDKGSSFANPNFTAMPKMLTWNTPQERDADMKKGTTLGRIVNNYEDSRDPNNSMRFKVLDFKDYFANPVIKAPDGRTIGLEPDAFKDFSELVKFEGEWRIFK